MNIIWPYLSIVRCGGGANWFVPPGCSSIKSCAPGFAVARCFQRGCYFQENCALANGEGLNGVLRVMKTTLLVPHDCKKNHHRLKFCHCVFYSVLRRELSAYSMFWWGMAVKKLLSFSSLKFSYSYGCLLACLRAIHKWRYTKLFPIFLTTLPSLFHLYCRAVGTGLPRVAAATTIF